jgi:RNA polymerase primary sigma factor
MPKLINVKIKNKTFPNEILTLYFKDINKYSILTPNEEYLLIERVKKGDINAKNELIQSNQRFVVSVAKKFSRKDNLLDYVNQGNIGLIKSIDRFDNHRGLRFISFAVHYIYKEINEYMVKEEPMIYKTNIGKTYSMLNIIKNNFFCENGRFPENEELMELINEHTDTYQINEVSDLFDVQIVSIDANYENDLGIGESYINSNLNEFDMKTAQNNLYLSNIDKEVNIKLCNDLLSILSDRDQEVIKLLFGIGKPYTMSVEDVAIKTGIGIERIRQIRRNALSNIRSKAKSYL